MTISLEMPGQSVRYFHGLVSRFAQVEGGGGYASYAAVLKPFSFLAIIVVSLGLKQNPNELLTLASLPPYNSDPSRICICAASAANFVFKTMA